MEPAHTGKPLELWLLTTGLLAFGLFLLWHFDIIAMIIEQDRTRLSLLIICLFMGACLYLGYASLRLVQLGNSVARFAGTGQSDGAPDAALMQLLSGYRAAAQTDNTGQSLHAWLVERIHRGHSLGWFISESLIRLGLIGTVIGFILMLGSVYGLEEQNINTLKDLVRQMGGGMQVALYTTLTGITCSLVLNIYCRNLDRCADDLIGRIIFLCLNDRAPVTDDAHPV